MEKKTIIFLKDLFWSAIFLIFMYAVTHNPLVFPRPKIMEGMWAIEKMQHPLLFGLSGHNFLIIRNGDGEIVAELHGLATDMENRVWRYLGTNENEKLKVWEFTESRYDRMTEFMPGIVLAQGNEKEIKSLWDKALVCAERINEKNIPYTPYGVTFSEETENSNSVAYTIAKCIGIEKRHLGLVTPGSKTDLLED